MYPILDCQPIGTNFHYHSSHKIDDIMQSGMRWVPMEANPTVMNEGEQWARKAGLVTSEYNLSDIYGFDEDLLALVPQPVKAIVLLFPYEELLPHHREEDSQIQKDGQYPIDPAVVWIKQTIDNACGTMGLIHSLLNY
ncbi:hypothetical protein EUX98_g1801 [Antrodiella citrinella]|uniref:Ubiquitin carboxyl-terminal hydrolase n=1 Tax=Antrodiella citrinella TaxID=2447956 RepID=A0A4S4N0G6_9APHY|nr:hypothetical protein EUX98_g1801 [Antrodiella citrinella]